MEDINSPNALFVDADQIELNREVFTLLDEVGVNYRIVSGCDWQGIDPPWLFFSESGKFFYGIEEIKRLANLCWWHKVAQNLETGVGENRGRQWIEEPNALLDGRTPLQAYKEGDGKAVFDACRARMKESVT